jgi:hypothetical protein
VLVPTRARSREGAVHLEEELECMRVRQIHQSNLPTVVDLQEPRRYAVLAEDPALIPRVGAVLAHAHDDWWSGPRRE